MKSKLQSNTNIAMSQKPIQNQAYPIEIFWADCEPFIFWELLRMIYEEAKGEELSRRMKDLRKSGQ